MKFTSSLIALLPLLTASVAYAAECANWESDMQLFIRDHEDMLWSLRQRMCGNGECGNSQECTLYGNSKEGGASLYRKDVQYNYPNCWDATENIITQCSRNWWKQGWWQLGDEFYQFNVSPNYGWFKRDVDVDGEANDVEVQAKVEAEAEVTTPVTRPLEVKLFGRKVAM